MLSFYLRDLFLSLLLSLGIGASGFFFFARATKHEEIKTEAENPDLSSPTRDPIGDDILEKTMNIRTDPPATFKAEFHARLAQYTDAIPKPVLGHFRKARVCFKRSCTTIQDSVSGLGHRTLEWLREYIKTLLKETNDGPTSQ